MFTRQLSGKRRHNGADRRLYSARTEGGSALCRLACLILATPMFAQAPGTLSGTATDPSGAAVVSAAVEAKNADTGASRSTLTDAAGRYTIPSLAVGRYELRARAKGFREEVRTGIQLAGDQSATVDIKMQPSAPDACASGHEFATTDCALAWHGITLYGAYDAGVGWVSHGLPENATNYEGESLVNRNGYQHRFLIAPNNLQQTGLGIRGKEEFLPGWSVVFNASTGINPQSGQLANASATDIGNNGLPRSSYSEARGRGLRDRAGEGALT